MTSKRQQEWIASHLPGEFKAEGPWGSKSWPLVTVDDVVRLVSAGFRSPSGQECRFSVWLAKEPATQREAERRALGVAFDAAVEEEQDRAKADREHKAWRGSASLNLSTIRKDRRDNPERAT